jgi:hypothetical protein
MALTTSLVVLSAATAAHSAEQQRKAASGQAKAQKRQAEFVKAEADKEKSSGLASSLQRAKARQQQVSSYAQGQKSLTAGIPQANKLGVG